MGEKSWNVPFIFDFNINTIEGYLYSAFELYNKKADGFKPCQCRMKFN